MATGSYYSDRGTIRNCACSILNGASWCCVYGVCTAQCGVSVTLTSVLAVIRICMESYLPIIVYIVITTYCSKVGWHIVEWHI